MSEDWGGWLRSPAPFRDYQAEAHHLIAGTCPERLAGMVAWVEEWTPPGARLVEVGAGNGVLAAVLTRNGRPTLAVDIQARNVVATPYEVMDARSGAFFELLRLEGPAAVLCRRSLADVARAGWAERVLEAGVELLLSQACEAGESVAYPGAEVEARYLRAEGWGPVMLSPPFLAARCTVER